jgi:undecaprenyl diphosphate synthase
MEEKNKLRHVAIIMDGNGRWAKDRGLEHIEGHKEGSKAVQRTIEAAKEFGIEYLTLYAFSTENWKRPKREVNGLMSLLRNFIDKNLNEIIEKGIRIKAIGRLGQIPFPTRKKLFNAIEKTKNNTKGTVVLAISYGGRAEIIDAAKKIAEDAIKGKIKPKNLDEKIFKDYLYDPEVPDPELMIRTSGEFRISNFLLWELSYSEFYISDVYWPDFDKIEFQKAIDNYYKRNRRFGGRK